MVVVILFAIILSLLIAILLLPVVLTVDTQTNRYEMRQPGIFRYNLHPDHQEVHEFRIFGIRIHPGRKSERPDRKKPVRKKKVSVFRRRSVGSVLRLVRTVYRSFRIRHCLIDIDTGDVILNAQLVPLAMWASGRERMIGVNFEGRVVAHIVMTFFPARTVLGVLRFLLFK